MAKDQLEECLQLLKNGNLNAITPIYKQMSKPVYTVAFAILKDEGASQDIMEDTFIKVRQNINNYQENTNPSAWILTIARNLALMEYRKRKKEVMFDVQEHDYMLGTEENNYMVYSLIKHDISVISAHTNFDKYDYGTCYAMAEILNLEPLDSSDIEIGLLTKADFTSRELAERCKQVFGDASCTLPDNELSKVFICAGSGSSMKEEVLARGADCLFTGECKYHDMLDLAEMGISTVSVGHDLSESISLSTLADIIKNEFKDIKVEVFTAEPLQLII